MFDKDNCKKNLDSLDLSVQENRVDKVNSYTLKTTPIDNITYEAMAYPANELDVVVPYILEGTILLVLPFIHDSIFLMAGLPKDTLFYDLSRQAPKGPSIPGTLRIYSRSKIKDDLEKLDDQTFLVTKNGPAVGASIEVRGKDLRIGGLFEEAVYTTYSNGATRVEFSPERGFLTRKEAASRVENILNETYKQGALNGITNGMSFLEEMVVSVSAKTRDDEMTFEVPIYIPTDPRLEVNSRIKKSLESYLSQKFPLKKIEIEVREKISRIFLNNVGLESKQLSGPTEETVVSEERSFLSSFFNSETDYVECFVEPRRFLSEIPKELEFSKKLSGTINKGSVYEIEFTHNRHVAASEKIDFDSEKNPIPVLMDRLAAPIENRETTENAGISTIGNKK